MDPVYQALANLVGKEYVSNQPEELYIYSFDLGTSGTVSATVRCFSEDNRAHPGYIAPCK